MQGYEAARFYDTRQSEAIGLIQSYESLSAHVQSRLESLLGLVAQARLEAAQAYLKQLTPEALARVQHLTGFLGFERRDPMKAMAHETTVLEATIAQIADDERYQNRQLYAGPDGTLNSKLVEIEELLAPFATECQSYEEHEGFLELFAADYDTPEFQGKWWQASYWKHWAAGDRICKQLGVDDFGDDVLPAYRKAAEQRAFWQGERDGITGQISVIHERTQKHDAAVARIPTLPALYLAQSQTYLAEYLEQADGSLLESWLSERGDAESGADRPTVAALRKLSGLKAKQGYLQELQTQGLKEAIDGMRKRAWKFSRKSQKYLRSKNYHRKISDSELDHKFAQKYGKYKAQPGKLRKLVDRIYAYEAYDRFDQSNDPELWWFEMTNKKPPGHWSTTRRWYDRRTDFQIQHDAANSVADAADTNAVATAVATATAARDLDEVGYLS